MKPAEVRIIMQGDGELSILSSVPDAGLMLILMEKAKLKILEGVKLEEKSKILQPTNGSGVVG